MNIKQSFFYSRIAIIFLCILYPATIYAVQYTYDDRYQLTHVEYNDGIKITYTYDTAGNRLSKITTTVLKGDINNDGSVTLADAVLVLQVISGVPPATSVKNAADVNSDGKIGLAEVIFILQKIAGMR
jgi:YD repeat-containing protein